MSSQTKIWGDGYKVFLSHKADVKQDVTALKYCLESYGISAFVAHEDITPSEEWQGEIQKALNTMESFVALLTDGFHDSEWTDQEIGYALCREVPIVAVRLGIDPYGFIGKIQGLSGGWNAAPLEIVKILVNKDPAMIDHYIGAVEGCESFDQGNRLSEVLSSIPSLSDNQVSRLVIAFNSSEQVNHSYGFNGTRPNQYGDGLARYLSRVTRKEHVIWRTDNGSQYKLVLVQDGDN